MFVGSHYTGMLSACRKVLLIYLVLRYPGGLIGYEAATANWKTSQHGQVSRGRRAIGYKDIDHAKSPEKEVVLGLLIPYRVTGGADLSAYTGGEYYAAAFLLAIEDINNRTDLLPNVKLKYVWNDTMCLVDMAIKSQIWQHCSFQGSQRTGVDAFIGTGCKCTTAVRNAVALNLPIISHVSVISRLNLDFFLFLEEV